MIFDLFCTLVSPEDVWPARFNRERAAALALEVDPAAFESFWWTDGMERYVGEPVADLLRKSASLQGLDTAAEAVAAALAVYGEYHDRALASPRSEVLTGLEGLRERGYALALLSNADDREVANWHRSPLSQLIPDALFSYQIGSVKPDLPAYEAVLSRLGVPAESVVYVGDGGSSEFEGARRAGIQHIICITGFGTEAGLRPHSAIKEASTLADVAVPSVRGIVPYLNSLR
ncbi:MAG: HAD family hydrolase [Actinobacteria bacterium]|nr:HAD family hydrolase [Actinomycetota bacterium]